MRALLAQTSAPLTWLHFGDLHVSADDGFESLAAFEALVVEANAQLAAGVDFAFLPGDNANHGEPDQYRGIRRVIDRLRLPVHVIPGDHDFEPKSLDAFYDDLGARRLPYGVTIHGRRCLFLDVVSAGRGGPDLRLGRGQRRWLELQLQTAADDSLRPVVFMHAFPADLTHNGQAIARAFAGAGVALVSTGHTHYNELLNDGAVIYSAMRSNWQVEEGPPGFALAAVDGSAPRWRFKPLGSPWPFVLIISAADARLVTASEQQDQVPAGAFPVRAKVFGAEVDSVRLTAGRPPRCTPTPTTRRSGRRTSRPSTTASTTSRSRRRARTASTATRSPWPPLGAREHRQDRSSSTTGRASGPGSSGASSARDSGRTPTGASGEPRHAIA